MKRPLALWSALVVSAVALGLSFDVFTFTATYGDIYRGTIIVVSFVLPAVWLWWGVPAAVAFYFVQLGAAVLGGAGYDGRYLWGEVLRILLRAVIGLAIGLSIRRLRAHRSSLRPAWPSKDPSDYR